MSTTYKHPKDVPNDVLARRLRELGLVVVDERRSADDFAAHFTMRVPAEVDRDADIVLYEASKRVDSLTERDRTIAELRQRAEAAEAKLDAVMLEYCPDEMTEEQRERWAMNQVPAQGTAKEQT